MGRRSRNSVWRTENAALSMFSLSCSPEVEKVFFQHASFNRVFVPLRKDNGVRNNIIRSTRELSRQLVRRARDVFDGHTRHFCFDSDCSKATWGGRARRRMLSKLSVWLQWVLTRPRPVFFLFSCDFPCRIWADRGRCTAVSSSASFRVEFG